MLEPIRLRIEVGRVNRPGVDRLRVFPPERKSRGVRRITPIEPLRCKQTAENSPRRSGGFQPAHKAAESARIRPEQRFSNLCS